MRKPGFLVFIVLVVVLTLVYRKELADKTKQVAVNETRYLIDLNETIDKAEAKNNPPKERWNVIKQLTETTSIEVINDPSSYSIQDQNRVKEIVMALQDSKYVEASAFPHHEPDAKVYFKKKEGFIMAGRFYKQEGIIISPEGPIISIHAKAVSKIME